jgi:hypothetical protein
MIMSTERSISYWELHGVIYPLKINMVFLTEKDLAWWEEYKNSHNTICKNRCDEFFVPGNSASYGGGVSPSNFGTPDFKEITIQYYIGSQYPKDPTSEWALDVEGPHEFIHAIQFAYAKNTFYQLPCWLIEGSARFYERNMYNQNNAPSEWTSQASQRIGEIKDFQTRIDKIGTYAPSRSWNEDNYLTFVKDHYTTDTSSDSTCSATLFGYKIGSILMEKFYSQFGSDGLIGILENVAKGSTWSTSFAKQTGLSEENWLREQGFAYLLEQINLG